MVQLHEKRRAYLDLSPKDIDEGFVFQFLRESSRTYAFPIAVQRHRAILILRFLDLTSLVVSTMES
jgi:hypothetical protein